jgi:hypothetical protein
LNLARRGNSLGDPARAGERLLGRSRSTCENNAIREIKIRPVEKIEGINFELNAASFSKEARAEPLRYERVKVDQIWPDECVTA